MGLHNLICPGNYRNWHPLEDRGDPTISCRYFGTPAISSGLRPKIRCSLVRNEGPYGFGRAIIKGLTALMGDAVVIMMADESDDVRDVVIYWKALNEGFNYVFGSRVTRAEA
jgi:hypothetical protein